MILTVNNIRKTYKKSVVKVEALKGVSFQLHQGEIFGFIGPNGAGKTTLIKIIAGILRPDEGEVLLDGKPPTDPQAKKLRGFLPENPQTFRNLTGEEFLFLCAGMLEVKNSSERVREALKTVGLTGAASRRLSTYSKGMLQRIFIAQSLLADPPLLVYDEPLSGLDPIGRKEVKDIIKELREKGKTVFFSSHIIEDVEELVDRVGVIKEGRLIKLFSLKETERFVVKYLQDNSLMQEEVSRDKLWEKLEELRNKKVNLLEVKGKALDFEELLKDETV